MMSLQKSTEDTNIQGSDVARGKSSTLEGNDCEKKMIMELLGHLNDDSEDSSVLEVISHSSKMREECIK